MNGREAEEAEPILKALPNMQQYVFCSSAGVYLKSDEMPHREEDAVDPKSRHKVGGCHCYHADHIIISISSSSSYGCIHHDHVVAIYMMITL